VARERERALREENGVLRQGVLQSEARNAELEARADGLARRVARAEAAVEEAAGVARRAVERTEEAAREASSARSRAREAEAEALRARAEADATGPVGALALLTGLRARPAPATATEPAGVLFSSEAGSGFSFILRPVAGGRVFYAPDRPTAGPDGVGPPPPLPTGLPPYLGDSLSCDAGAVPSLLLRLLPHLGGGK